MRLCEKGKEAETQSKDVVRTSLKVIAFCVNVNRKKRGRKVVGGTTKNVLCVGGAPPWLQRWYKAAALRRSSDDAGWIKIQANGAAKRTL